MTKVPKIRESEFKIGLKILKMHCKSIYFGDALIVTCSVMSSMMCMSCYEPHACFCLFLMSTSWNSTLNTRPYVAIAPILQETIG